MIKCSLCGYEFDETNLACHSQCPMSDNCAIICCPNCGYQVVDESKTWGVTVLKNLVARLQKPKAAKRKVGDQQSSIVNLRELPPGETAEVVEITSSDVGRLLRLSALGIVPGSRIRVTQQYPVCIIWAGETQLSVDGEVAGDILVKLE